MAGKTDEKPADTTAESEEQTEEQAESQGDSTPEEEESSSSGGKGDGSQKDAGKGKKGEQKTYSEEEVTRIVEKRLKASREEARRKAIEEEAKKQGNFEKLYETARTELEEVKGYKDRYEKLSQLQNAAIDSEIKDFPSEAREFDPGSEDLEKRLEWLPKARKLAQRLKASTTAPDSEHGKKGEPKDKLTVNDYLKNRYPTPVVGKK